MKAFESYCTYLAVHQHFTSKSYDFFKYKGKVRAKESSFRIRKDKYFFEKASKNFKREEFVNFLVANYVCNTDDRWIGNLLSGNPEKYKNVSGWKKRIDSSTYSFREDVCNIIDQDISLDDSLKMIDGKHPYIYRAYLRKKISLETLVILDDLVGYSRLWKRYGDIMLNDQMFLMDKYRPFLHQAIQFDRAKFREIVLYYHMVSKV
jgi:hypothetical protein